MRPPRGDRGFMTVWMLGLCVVLIFLGGVSLDLWRAFSERRSLAGAADSAAAAGASGIDQAALREGSIRLDPGRARALAEGYLATGTDAPALSSYQVEVAPDGSSITVRAEGSVRLSLLRIFLRGPGSLPIGVSARSVPRLFR